MTFAPVERIWQMSYPDFVAFIDQENSPPGGSQTLDWWLENAGMRAESRLLDLACNTGYSSRGLARRTGCRASGIDISETAIASARAGASAARFEGKLDYRVGDVCRLPWADAEFSHVVAGCCFGFFAERELALTETARVLEPGGLLCVSTLPYVQTPPASLLDDLQLCLGFRPDPECSLRFWRDFFGRRFDAIATWNEPLPVLSEAQLAEAAVAHMVLHAHRFDGLTQDQREATLLRLLRDRTVFNDNRRYQSCCRWVLRLREQS